MVVLNDFALVWVLIMVMSQIQSFCFYKWVQILDRVTEY